MELCATCGNVTASDITGAFYCVVCGSKQPEKDEYPPPPRADEIMALEEP